ncbi:MAG: CHC2 zinc finger domain-containing protein [Candidatus Paceibacterota bacterium]|jgi:DNA primase
MYDLDAIKERVHIEDLVGETVQLRKSGSSYLGMCPNHPNTQTPALAVWPESGTWKCFGACGDGGDVFAWTMKRDGVEFKEAVRMLAEKCALTPGPSPRAGEGGKAPAAAPMPTGPGEAWRARAEEFILYAEQKLLKPVGERARAYLLEERGLWEETWAAFRLGYNPANIYDDPARWGLDGNKIWLPRGLVIPGFWRGGIPWYVKIRRPRPQDSLARYIGALEKHEAITGNPEKDSKFGGPRGGESALFGHYLNWKSNPLPVLILTEGEWDTMICWQWGQDLAAFGTIGGAAAKVHAQGMAHLVRFAAVGVVMDADAAGDKARVYWSELQAVAPRVQIIEPPDHDLTDYWKHGGNLRAWLAKTVETLLGQAVQQAEEAAPEQWMRLLTWAAVESKSSVGSNQLPVEMR